MEDPLSRLSVVATFALTILPSLSLAEGYKYKVKLAVSCDRCADTVRSYIARELRKLPDVVVTDVEPDYELSVVALETRTQTGAKTGYAMAVLVVDLTLRNEVAASEAQSYELLRKIIAKCPGEGSEILDNSLKRQAHLLAMNLAKLAGEPKLSIRTFPQDSLEQQCRDVIAQFDGSELERSRQALSMFK
jgi:hypothetical protein